MRSVNKVILMGHLSIDPELKQTQKGSKLVRFSVATNRDWQTSDGDRRQFTDFHKIVAFGKLGEHCESFLKKGSAIYLEGRISNRSYVDKEGKKRFSTEIVADVIHFISYKKNKDSEEINLVEVPE